MHAIAAFITVSSSSNLTRAGTVLLLASAECRRSRAAATTAFVGPAQLPQRSHAWSEAHVTRQAPARVGRIAMEVDFYQELGIGRQASEKEIKNVRLTRGTWGRPCPGRAVVLTAGVLSGRPAQAA